jgi:lycopene cyclase domain-containing protein
MHYIYSLLLLFTLSYPLFKSFEDKIAFHKRWKFLFPAILISATFFIIWDIWFTSIGIWKFNSDYVLGLFIFKLPIEEWLFFFITPFSCVFIYEVMNYFVKKDVLAKQAKYITTILAIILLVLAIIYHDKLYTFVDFILLSVFLFIHQFIIKSNYLGRFYITWAICIIPFLLVNGVITAMPIVIYNNLENINIRIWTIPVEDLFYGMLNFLQVITIYEFLKQKSKS